MKSQNIPFQQTGMFSKIFCDYIEQNASLKNCYQQGPAARKQEWLEIIETRKKFPFNRSALVERLEQQYRQLRVHDNLSENIQLLRTDNCFSCTTAHQPVLLGGPLYLIYKVLSVIKCSRQLNEMFSEEGYRFVPVFWLGGEDHDWQECNHLNLFGKTYSWEKSGQESVGRRSCEGLPNLIQEITELFPKEEEVQLLLKQLEKAAEESENINAFYTYFLNELFGKYGLVVLDADNAQLKKLFAPIMQEEIRAQLVVQSLQDHLKSLSANYNLQAEPREVNLFYMGRGMRQRLIKTESGFSTVEGDQHWITEKLLEEIEQNAENFSPNVFLRPIYQSLCLPDISFVGGPGEIAYWLELLPLFKRCGLFYPNINARNCLLWIDAKMEERWNKAGFSLAELFLHEHEIAKNYLRRRHSSLDFEKEQQALIEVLSSLEEKAIAADPGLKSYMAAESVKWQKQLEGIELRIRKALKSREEIQLKQLTQIKQRCFPNGQLQERDENFLPYYARYGESYFELLLEAFESPVQEFKIVVGN